MTETKHQKITNKLYREFIVTNLMRFVNENDINLALARVKGRYSLEGRALIIAMYYTGARPNEILRLFGKDIVKEGNYVMIQLPASKGGKPRRFEISYKKPLAKELYNYSRTVFPQQYLFYHYCSKYVRTVTKKDGSTFTRNDISAKLGHYFKKWFAFLDGSISPYYLRHNRFSKLITRGASIQEIVQLKGSKTEQSVQPYLHMSKKTARRIASIND
jgi:site-specific recombinase XerD